VPAQFGEEAPLYVTMWRTLRGFLLLVIVVAIVFTIFSIGVAVGTADKCGQIHAEKDWHYFPPGWDCVTK
jgi:hypothetical protein